MADKQAAPKPDEKLDFEGVVSNVGSSTKELTEALEGLVQTCVLTGKGGTITYTISVKPEGHGKVRVTDDIKVKAPKFPRKDALFFANEHGELSRKQPGQLELFDEDGKSKAAG